eukprot:GEMP01029132.1.p1 GENE.GEMP01029132.1~~GEMP01029132.1.p1  ORF type:complete len:323 (+),score=45.65 GEMP01029132.1:22-990(+)
MVSLLWNWIIRPPRLKYCSAELSDPVFLLPKACVAEYGQRREIIVHGARGYELRGSLYSALPAHPFLHLVEDPHCVVIFLHGSASNQLEGSQYVNLVLERGWSLFTFDFGGSGNSEGEFISLGYHEAMDIACVLQRLRKELGAQYHFVLWGRSMGAAAALLHSADPYDVPAGLVLDSPFASLKETADRLSKHYLGGLGDLLVDALWPIVRWRIKELNDFDVDDVKPVVAAKMIKCPTLLIYSNDDELVLPVNSEQIAGAARQSPHSPKVEVCRVEGGHNSMRHSSNIKQTLDFIQRRFEEKGFQPPPRFRRSSSLMYFFYKH